MKKIIPLSKQSKKLQKEYYKKKRNSWNGLNPVTRIKESKKIYKRKNSKNDIYSF